MQYDCIFHWGLYIFEFQDCRGKIEDTRLAWNIILIEDVRIKSNQIEYLEYFWDFMYLKITVMHSIALV